MNNKLTSLIYCFCSLNGIFRGKENSLKRIRRREKALTESEPHTLKFISGVEKNDVPLMTLRVISNGGELEGEQL